MIRLTQPATPEPVLLNRAEAGRLLAIGRRPIDRLIDDQWVTPTVTDIAALAQRAWVQPIDPLPVLRLGAPDVDPTDGRLIGIAPHYTDDEVLEAARKWWRCDAHVVADTGALLVTVAGFVVALLAIDDIEGDNKVITDSGAHVTRYAFTARLAARVDNLAAARIRILHPDNHIDALLPALGQRLPNPPGSPLTILTPETSL